MHPTFFPSIQTTVEPALQRGGKERLQAQEEKKKEAITNRKRKKLRTNNNNIMMEISGYDSRFTLGISGATEGELFC